MKVIEGETVALANCRRSYFLVRNADHWGDVHREMVGQGVQGPVQNIVM